MKKHNGIALIEVAKLVHAAGNILCVSTELLKTKGGAQNAAVISLTRIIRRIERIQDALTEQTSK